MGDRPPDGRCDWCAAPARARIPLAVAWGQWLRRSPVTASLRRRGAVATGVMAGIFVHLLAAAVGVAAGLPSLWQTGFLWSEQWWWALAPEAAQPWLFAAARGAAYGALAGFLAALQTPGARRQAPNTERAFAPSPAGVVALAAFIVSGWDPTVGTQHCLVAAGLGAVVALVAFVVSGWDPAPVKQPGLAAAVLGVVVAFSAFIVSGWVAAIQTQDMLVAAALAAVVGRLTTLVMRAR